MKYSRSLRFVRQKILSVLWYYWDFGWDNNLQLGVALYIAGILTFLDSTH